MRETVLSRGNGREICINIKRERGRKREPGEKGERKRRKTIHVRHNADQPLQEPDTCLDQAAGIRMAVRGHAVAARFVQNYLLTIVIGYHAARNQVRDKREGHQGDYGNNETRDCNVPSSVYFGFELSGADCPLAFDSRVLGHCGGGKERGRRGSWVCMVGPSS